MLFENSVMYILLTCDVCSISCYFVIYIQLPCSYEVKARVYVDLKFQENQGRSYLGLD